MKILPVKIVSFLLSDEAATAIEYGLIAGGIALAIVSVVFALGTDLSVVFNTIDSSMQTVASNAQAASSG